MILLAVLRGVVCQAQDAPPGLALMDAVRLTLAHDPNVAIQEARLDVARGALLVAAGQFDPVVASQVTRADTNLPLSLLLNQDLRTLQTTASVTQQLRNGLSIEPQLNIDRTQDLTAGSAALTLGTLTFQLRQPLLRGRGRDAVQAAEHSAEREVAATGLDLRHTVSQRVMVVAAQYWQARAAESSLDVLRANERSARELLANTRKLIAADEVPAADVVQLEASLASAESARIGGERDLFAQKQSLGREIGLDPAEIAVLPLPADPFPGVRSEEVPPDAQARGFMTLALGHRADLEAARQRVAEADFQRKAAENALKPQLDLILAPGYTGVTSGGGTRDYFSPLVHDIPGASTSISLALSWPTFNQAARGALLQVDATRRQDALAVDLLAKGIGADVPAALDAVGRDALQLDRAREAVRLYERTVGNEEKKLKGGTSTLLDLITQRDRLVAARQTEVAAELALALALLDLRFETGTLIGNGGQGGNGGNAGNAGQGGQLGEIEPARLTTLPSLQEDGR